MVGSNIRDFFSLLLAALVCILAGKIVANPLKMCVNRKQKLFAVKIAGNFWTFFPVKEVVGYVFGAPKQKKNCLQIKKFQYLKEIEIVNLVHL